MRGCTHGDNRARCVPAVRRAPAACDPLPVPPRKPPQRAQPVLLRPSEI